MKQGVEIDEENLSPAVNSDDEEQLRIQKTRRLENLDKARQAKKAKASAEPPRGKTASARILGASRACNVEDSQDTQQLLNRMDNYLQNYYGTACGTPDSHSDTDDDATQGYTYGNPDFTASLESQPIL